MHLPNYGLNYTVTEPDAQAKFSIIIPTWNNLAYLKLCIESIKKNSTFQHQLIVFVNEGNDGTVDWLRNEGNIDYYHSNVNVGVCYALNASRTLAYTSYIVFMNDDMYACPGWDKVLYDEILAIGHKWFFLSATAIEPRRNHPSALVKNFGTDIQTFDEAALLKDFESLEMPDWLGATWPPNVVHKDVWDFIGGYSVEFSPGLYADPDFSKKLWEMGIRYFKGLSKSRVYHFGSVSLNRIKKPKGSYIFLGKWNISQNLFSRKFLRRGETFDGPLKNQSLSFGNKVHLFYKKIKSAFKIR